MLNQKYTWVDLFVLGIALVIPLSIYLAFHFENPFWIVPGALALLVFMIG